MRRTRSNNRVIWCRLYCLAGLTLFVYSARGQYDPDWARHIRVGAMAGFNIKADFKLTGIQNFNHQPGVYDDGFVRVDQTGNDGGLTTFWGYNNSSQISGQTLTMHDTTSFAPTGNASTKVDGGPFPGIDLAYGGNLWYWRRARIGWDFGFGFLPINISANQSASGNVTQSTFTFDTSDMVGGVPPAGYQGPFQAPSGSLPPFLLPSTPTSTNTTTTQGGTITGTQTLDVMLYTFRLGPSVYWDFNRYLGMSVGVGPAVGIVSGDLKFDEIISTGTTVHSKGQVSGTDVVYGGYVNASLMYHVMRNGDFYLSAQYMPLGKATISGQGRQGRLDLSGQVYISAGVNWPF
jgi:hypothetical protein